LDSFISFRYLGLNPSHPKLDFPAKELRLHPADRLSLDIPAERSDGENLKKAAQEQGLRGKLEPLLWDYRCMGGLVCYQRKTKVSGYGEMVSRTPMVLSFRNLLAGFSG
jgi:hypothetical protein